MAHWRLENRGIVTVAGAAIQHATAVGVAAAFGGVLTARLAVPASI